MKFLKNNNKIFFFTSLFIIISFITLLMLYSFYQNKEITKERTFIGHKIGGINQSILKSHIYIEKVIHKENENSIDSLMSYFNSAKKEINTLILKDKQNTFKAKFTELQNGILEFEKTSILKLKNIDDYEIDKKYDNGFDNIYITSLKVEKEVENYLVTKRKQQNKTQLYLIFVLFFLFIFMMFLINYVIKRLIKSRKNYQKLLKQNETLLKAIPDIITEVDNNKIIRWTNSAGYNFFGKDVIGKEASYYFIEDKDTYNQVAPVFAGNETTIYVENWQRRKDGEKRLFAWWVRTLKNEKGNVIGALSTARDITEINESQQELETYKNHLERMIEERTFDLVSTNQELYTKIKEKTRAERKIKKQKDLIDATNTELRIALNEEKKYSRIKNNFVAQTSHEFRTPLAAIGFAAGFLKKYYHRLDDTVINKKLAKIENEIQILLKLLDNVLNLEKSNSKKYNFVKYNLNEFLEPIIEEVKAATQGTHEVLFLNSNGNTKIYIDYDIGRNIFINLLYNAIKFSPEQAHIEVECIVNNDFTTISIKDYGIGLNKRKLLNLFEPFNRGINVGDITGTGLGLAIVKEALDKCKWQLEVESKIGEGSTFTVKIPKKYEKNINN